MRKRGGYTLAEMLIVLLLLSLTVAIAVPTVAKIALDAQIRALNDRARAAYMAAYSRSYRGLARSGDDDSVKLIYNVDGENLSDFADSCRSMIVEYVNSPAPVTGVFISDELTPEELELAYREGKLFNEKLRRRLRVGYYGGETDKFPDGDLYRLSPRISVSNGEELFVRIDCENALNGSSVELTLRRGMTVEKLDLGGSVETGVVYLLDSVNQPFAERFHDLSGGEVTASAEIIYNGTVIGRTAEVGFDPLFESRSREKVCISKVRHLNNLRYLDGENYVEQTADICFAGVPGEEFRDGRPHDMSILPLPDFEGTYDGGEHFIKNISVNQRGDMLALFSRVSGTVKNLHIAGQAEFCAASRATIAGICGRLEASGSLVNCSVSELNVTAPDGSTVGGLAGEAAGKIENCSAVLGKVSLGIACRAGGIAADLDGGTVAFSHSAGQFVSAEKSRIYGVCGGSGDVESCYSECCAGYLSGSEFVGVSECRAENSYYLIENAWLASDLENACRRGELTLPGYAPPLLMYADEGYSTNAGDLPESVTLRDLPTRFGSCETPSPRGLIGLMKVTFDGERFGAEVIHCFDFYGNDSAIHPDAAWDDPKVGEWRYYIYYSESASPKGGENGYEFTAPGLGGETKSGFFI